MSTEAHTTLEGNKRLDQLEAFMAETGVNLQQVLAATLTLASIEVGIRATLSGVLQAAAILGQALVGTGDRVHDSRKDRE